MGSRVSPWLVVAVIAGILLTGCNSESTTPAPPSPGTSAAPAGAPAGRGGATANTGLEQPPPGAKTDLSGGLK